jgi:hypothetical protein
MSGDDWILRKLKDDKLEYPWRSRFNLLSGHARGMDLMDIPNHVTNAVKRTAFHLC